ncbi:MAG: hypothetical protein KF727_06700 [Microbacteriaceae bacterium]|nr:hypothetical protein [Microbacteriaceae bacterium]
MSDEIQLISDGDGLAVIGNPTVVERFLRSEGLASKDLDLSRLGAALSLGSGLALAGSEIAANSGRWVQMTKESAELAQKYTAMSKTGRELSTGVLRGDKGQFVHLVEFVKGPGSMLSNPAVLAGAAGIMAQIAMEQAMDEVTDYLAAIDEKVDDILRAQKDAVLADLIGVAFAIDEAMTLRQQVGRVSDVTWSKVQATPQTIARTQGYVLRQLDAIAEKLEKKTQIVDVARLAKDAEATAQEWLAVLARCSQLQDAVAVLELDRVLDASPGDLDQHRLALKAARKKRLEAIAHSTSRLAERMAMAASATSPTVALHPLATRGVVASSNYIGSAVSSFQVALGVESEHVALGAKPWREAVVETKDQVISAGADGVEFARELGDEALTRAWQTGAKVGSDLGELVDRASRRLRGKGGD